ncbi:MAG: rod shape-determining protein [Clostridia bacterium]|jgi:cell division protein ftsA|nr:rod shape-determining protein [Clostridia bacterium]
MGIISKDIGIDLGTSNIRIHLKGKGVVLSEPAVVAINQITGEILAVGNQAKEMIGRTPDSIVAFKPLKDGVIADFESTRALMQNLISRVVQKSLFYRPRIVVSIPSGITDVEERAVEGVVYKSGAKEVYLMEEVMAAAIGSGLEVEKPEGAMIVDLGGGTSEMAVLSLGGIVVSNSVKIAGEKLDKDIVEYIKQKFNVIIGDGEAEEVKKQIGAATAAMTEDRMEVKGRNLLTGLPETITVTTEDINEAMKDSLNEILRIIKLTLEQTPPELASDIMERGITLSGGLSLLRNIDRLISDETGMPVFIADEPEKCVVKGVGMALDNIEVLKKATKTRK